MKIRQEKPPFRPITIELRSHHEAEAFFSLIDKICACHASDGCDITDRDLDQEEVRLAIKLSNALTNKEVVI